MTTETIHAMLHDEGEWEQVFLKQALAMVERGEARELTGKAVSHYDDGMRTFDRIIAE